jgi:hypothetical protein
MSSQSLHKKGLLYLNYDVFVKKSKELSSVENINFNKSGIDWVDWLMELYKYGNASVKSGDLENGYIKLKMLVDAFPKIKTSTHFKNKTLQRMDDFKWFEDNLHLIESAVENVNTRIKHNYAEKKTITQPAENVRYSRIKSFFKRSFHSILRLLGFLHLIFISMLFHKRSLVKIHVSRNDMYKKEKLDVICMALEKIRNIFELNLDLNSDERQIELNGFRTKVNIVNKLLMANLPKIVCKKVIIEGLVLPKTNLAGINDLNKLKMSLEAISNQLLRNTKAIFKLKIHLNTEKDQKDFIEFYLIYFYNFAEISSSKDNVFKEVSNILINNLSACLIDVTNFKNFMQTQNWKNFEAESLDDKYVYYTTNSNGPIKYILLVGLNCQVTSIKLKIESFLKRNEFKNIKISLAEEDVSIFRLIVNFKKNYLKI